MNRNGAEIIVGLLERHGVSCVAGIPGGAALPLYDALWASPLRHVLARHEQGAGFIAQGIARATGRAGVCIATSGPGATNLLTAIADAKLDSIPLLAITAQVPSALIGTDAFQEVDTYSLTLPITKHNFAVRSAGELFKVVPEAFAIAESGRPGPVSIDVPKDVLNERVDFEAWPDSRGPELPDAPADPGLLAQLDQLAGWIEGAQRPVLYAGGGVVAATAASELTQFAQRNEIPVTTTLNALGAFPPGDRLSLGMLGMHGSRHCQSVLDDADLLIAVGARFDDRATGRPQDFCSGARRAHIDIDAAEIGKIVPVDLSIVCDARFALRALIERVRPRRRAHASISATEPDTPATAESGDDSRCPRTLIGWLSQELGPDAIVTTDVGQHQMWIAQHYPFRRARRSLTSGGLGTMGFGLPAAIGAALAEPNTRVLCVSGDGSILMNLQELATLAELKLDVKVLVMNNGHLGLVRQQQQLFYNEHYCASRFDRTPDFAAIARGFGIPALNLGESHDPRGALRRALRDPGPCLIDAPIAEVANVFPIVPPGAANRDSIHEVSGG
jgi:acetolactate synthase-1/2/3 large subunit